MKVVFYADDDNECTRAVVAHLEAVAELVRLDADGDWPDSARAAAGMVARGEARYGVVMCWTGTGVAIAANKVTGVRAALAWEPWIAQHARLWNDANVLALSLKRLAPAVAVECVEAFLAIDNPAPEEAANLRRLRQW